MDRDAEPEPASGEGVDADRPSMSFDRELAKRQSETGRMRARLSPLEAAELVEDPSVELHGNPRPGVLYPYFDLVRHAARAYRDRTSCGRVFEGVRDQIRHHP